MNKHVSIAAGALSIALVAVSAYSAVAKRPMTITERMVSYRSQIKRDQKTGDLTLKEVNDMNDRLTSVDAKIAKMKGKNAGKLSYKDEGKIEKSLNDIAVDMKAKELAKRVTSK